MRTDSLVAIRGTATVGLDFHRKNTADYESGAFFYHCFCSFLPFKIVQRFGHGAGTGAQNFYRFT